mgnify:CR=1 FL=1
MADPSVAYPDWYLQRWHFLPEGYVSRRSTRLYPAYIPNLYNQGRERQLLTTVANLVARGAPRRVLELGCGPGKALTTVGRRMTGAELTGMDLSPFFLEMADDAPALTALGTHLVHGDAGILPWVSESFDAVYAVHLFGHMPPEAARTAVDEAVRVLAPGGRLLVVDHAWHPWSAPSATQGIGTKSFNSGLIKIRVLERE